MRAEQQPEQSWSWFDSIRGQRRPNDLPYFGFTSSKGAFACIVLTCKKEEIPLKAVSDQVQTNFTVGQSAFSPVVWHPLELKRQQWFSCRPFYGQCSTRFESSELWIFNLEIHILPSEIIFLISPVYIFYREISNPFPEPLPHSSCLPSWLNTIRFSLKMANPCQVEALSLNALKNRWFQIKRSLHACIYTHSFMQVPESIHSL